MTTRIKCLGGAGRHGVKLGNPKLKAGTKTRPAAERKIAKSAEFAANVLPVARAIGGIYRHMAAVLNERRIATAQGGRWHAASVMRLMRRAL